MPKRRWKQPDKRMAAAVRYRAAGYSLREIGDRLGVDEATVRRDLAKWEVREAAALLAALGLPQTPDAALDAAAEGAEGAGAEGDRRVDQ